ncbi:MAG: hypothetical protein MUF10_10260, partial [Thermoanaerobaculaceae bacterium]|nr:hypothetical protein [Thermoanaerobaculaceae bacterium]
WRLMGSRTVPSGLRHIVISALSLAFFGFLLALAGCRGPALADGLRLAEAATGGFRQATASRDAAAGLELLTGELKATTTAIRLAEVFTSVHDELGEFRSARALRVRFMTLDDDLYTMLTYESTFRLGVAREHFAWRIRGGRARLDRYELSSPRLALPIKLIPKGATK